MQGKKYLYQSNCIWWTELQDQQKADAILLDGLSGSTISTLKPGGSVELQLDLIAVLRPFKPGRCSALGQKPIHLMII